MLAGALSMDAGALREPLLLSPEPEPGGRPRGPAGGGAPAPSQAATTIQRVYRGYSERRSIAWSLRDLHFELLKRLALLWEEHGVSLSHRAREFSRQDLGRTSVPSILRVNAAVEALKEAEVGSEEQLVPLGERKALVVYLKTFPKDERVALYERWGIPLHSKNRLQELVYHFLWNPGLGLDALVESARFTSEHRGALSDPKFAPRRDRPGSNALLLYQLERQAARPETRRALQHTASGEVGLAYARLLGSSVRAAMGKSPAKIPAPRAA